MLSGLFCFILPELSSHFVLHDLLRSFRLERPLPSSRVSPWDLLLVLCFLRGSPFESLSPCSLRDLAQKVLFLVSLATAGRVGELQAVSRDVSFSVSELYLSYIPEFRAKTESSVNPLPRSFCVRSLTDFVGNLPDELLLCPVRALRMYISRVSLSKNALSFFVISSLAPIPLHFLLLGLLLLLPHFGLIACVGSRLPGLFRETLLYPCCCYLVFFICFYVVLPN